MINTRNIGLGVAALLSAILVLPVLADGASDFQANAKKAASTLDQISGLVGNINTRVAAGGGAGEGATQQVSDTEQTMKCPVCGMTMSAKSGGANTKAVTIKGKTYYCCAGCNMTAIADKPAAGARRNGARRAPRNP